MCKKALRFSLVNISSCDEHFLWVTVLFPNPHSLCSHHFPPLHQRYCFILVSQSIMDGFGFLTMNPKFRPLFQTGQFELLKNERGQSSVHEQEKDYANIFQTDTHAELYNSSYLSPWLCVFVVNCWKSIHHFSAKWQGSAIPQVHDGVSYTVQIPSISEQYLYL